MSDPQFNGLQIARDHRGRTIVRLYRFGIITELAPDKDDEALSPGFYDEKMKKVVGPKDNTA